MYATVLILKIFAEVHIPGRRHNHVDVQTNEDEFDRELFEPTHEGSDGDEHAMDGDHGLHNETYTMRMESFSDMHKVLQQHLYTSC
jgi:hypothetical protein